MEEKTIYIIKTSNGYIFEGRIGKKVISIECNVNSLNPSKIQIRNSLEAINNSLDLIEKTGKNYYEMNEKEKKSCPNPPKRIIYPIIFKEFLK